MHELVANASNGHLAVRLGYSPVQRNAICRKGSPRRWIVADDSLHKFITDRLITEIGILSYVVHIFPRGSSSSQSDYYTRH